MLPDRAALVVAAVMALIVIWAGVTGELFGAPSAPAIAPRPAPDQVEQVALAAALLPELEVAPESHHGSYDRARFGNGWANVDGCTVRHIVLAEESLTEPAMDGCTVVGGEWWSWFDGQTVTDPAELDIDHLVPLAEAWSSGAHAWTDQEREAFANDLDRPDALVAVTASSNREKSDLDPAEWLPHHPDQHCRYAAAWVIQKHAWGLTVDAEEHAVLGDLLGQCSTADPDEAAHTDRETPAHA